MKNLGGDPHKINPLVPVDLVIDHSVIVDEFGNAAGPRQERRARIRAQRRALPVPEMGPGAPSRTSASCRPAPASATRSTSNSWRRRSGPARPRPTAIELAYPDTLVGTDSHTTMVNGLAVLGWGVGGIEAEAAMLGQPLSMLIPEVIGFKLTGKLREGVTATDLVLTVTQMLRKKGVVGKFVEFYGPGLDDMTVADRATIGNMAPEYGATCGFFPIDQKTLDYLTITGRTAERVALVEAYAKAQGMWRTADTPDPVFTDTLELDLDDVAALARRPEAAAGPRRPRRRQGRLRQARWSTEFRKAGELGQARQGRGRQLRPRPRRRRDRRDHLLHQYLEPERDDRRPACCPQRRRQGPEARSRGSRPRSRRAARSWRSISRRPACRTTSTSSASTSSASAAPPASATRGRCRRQSRRRSTTTTSSPRAVLSGNRNFEGRVNPDVRANYLASPPLVVAYALAGSMLVDLSQGAARHRQRRQARLPQGHLALEPRDPGVHRPHHHARAVQVAATPTCSSGDANWKTIAVTTGHDLRVGRRLDLRAEPALLRGHEEGAEAHPPTSSTRASSACSATRSPPTTSRPPAPSRRARRPANICSSHQVRGRRLQPVRHAARQPRGDDARHLRQHPHQEPDGEGRDRQRGRGRLHASTTPSGRADVDLRRRHALQGGRRAARRFSPARNTAPAPRATGRPRAPTCSACAP